MTVNGQEVSKRLAERSVGACVWVEVGENELPEQIGFADDLSEHKLAKGGGAGGLHACLGRLEGARVHSQDGLLVRIRLWLQLRLVLGGCGGGGGGCRRSGSIGSIGLRY